MKKYISRLEKIESELVPLDLPKFKPISKADFEKMKDSDKDPKTIYFVVQPPKGNIRVTRGKGGDE